jgi:hypothetical protein
MARIRVPEPIIMAQRTPTTNGQETQFRSLTDLQHPAVPVAQLEQLKRLLAAAQEEIDLLTGERDELVSAVKQWAHADRIERQELLFDAATQDMRSEIKTLRAEVKRLKRSAGTSSAPAEQRLRA